MIGRVWHGWTTPEDAPAYEAMVANTVLPGHEGLAGYRGGSLMRRELDGEVEFLVITRWESYDAIRAFAGEPCDATTIPPEAERLLARFDPRAVHYEQIGVPGREGTAPGPGP